MKVIILLVVIAFVAGEFTEEQKAKWRAFKLQHSKLFLSTNKEEKRMKSFLKNCEDVEEHNNKFLNGEETYTKAIHQDSDLSVEEFLAKRTGIPPEASVKSYNGSEVTFRQTPPTSVDLTLSGGIGPIRSQGSCGSCWTFSATCPVEYAYWKKTGQLLDLSEQQLVDCGYIDQPTYPYGGCKGGWMDQAYSYLAKYGGQAQESNYPYKAIQGTCNQNVARTAKLNSATPYTKVATDDNSIKNAIAKGAVTVCIDASGIGSYSSGVYSDSTYQAKQPVCNHAVVLVGYGYDSATGKYYWKMRNSWGTSYGEKGYYRLDMARGSTGNSLGAIIYAYTYYPNMA